MNKLLELQLNVWKLTGTINRLQAVETRSTDEDTELTTATTEYAAVNAQLVAEGEREHTRLEAARLAHPTDPAERELRALCGRANVGEIMTAVMERRSVDGATLEAQQAYGLGPNQVPLEMLRLEERAVTPGLDRNVATEEADVLPPVFATGAGAFFGYRPADRTDGRCCLPGVDDTAERRRAAQRLHRRGRDDRGLYRGPTRAPSESKRGSSTAEWTRSDSLLWIRRSAMALNGGLEEKLDYEVIAGTDGLLTGANLPNNNVSAVTTFADYISRFAYARVDGRFAAELGDLRTVAGATTYGHMGSVYRSNNADYSVVDSLMQKTAGVRVSAHVPAVTAAHKQNAVIRLGLRRDMVQPTWGGVTIIVDEYGELAGKGEIEVTAVLGMNTKILRADGFHKQQIQTQ